MRRITSLREGQETLHSVQLRMYEKTGQFETFALAPGPSIGAASSLRYFLTVDGTHCSSRYRMMLLTAVGTDAQGQDMLLAFALVPSETAEWWNWFSRFLLTATVTITRRALS